MNEHDKKIVRGIGNMFLGGIIAIIPAVIIYALITTISPRGSILHTLAGWCAVLAYLGVVLIIGIKAPFGESDTDAEDGPTPEPGSTEPQPSSSERDSELEPPYPELPYVIFNALLGLFTGYVVSFELRSFVRNQVTIYPETYSLSITLSTALIMMAIAIIVDPIGRYQTASKPGSTEIVTSHRGAPAEPRGDHPEQRTGERRTEPRPPDRSLTAARNRRLAQQDRTSSFEAASTGAIVTAIMYVIPVVNAIAPVFGGFVAGYTYKHGALGGVKVGALKGILMVFPVIALVALAGDFLFSIPLIGELLAQGAVLLLGLVVVHSAVVGMVGGFVGGLFGGKAGKRR